MQYCGLSRLSSEVLPGTISQVPIPVMKLAPSCLPHILMRKMLPFPETSGCHSPLSTWRALDNHPHLDVLGAGYLQAIEDIYIALCFLWTLSLYLFTVFLKSVLFLHSCYFSVSFEGVISFDAPCLSLQAPKLVETNMKTHLNMM